MCIRDSSSDTIMGLIHQLNRQGTTIVVITHDQDVANSLPRQISFRDGIIEHDSGAAPVPAGQR